MLKLKVHSSVHGLLLELEQKNDVTEIIFTKPNLKSLISRWIQHGLHEWYPAGDEKDLANYFPRTTGSNDPEFLPRIKSYLERQFHFTVELENV